MCDYTQKLGSGIYGLFLGIILSRRLPSLLARLLVHLLIRSVRSFVVSFRLAHCAIYDAF